MNKDQLTNIACEAEQKYEKYWDKLYQYFIVNSKNYTNLQEDWKDLFYYEMTKMSSQHKKDKEYDYILDGKIVSSNFEVYIKNKNKYLKKRIDQYLTNETNAIIDLGAGWGRHSIQLAVNNLNPSCRIIMGELTSSGRKIAEKFKDKYHIDMDILHFDWNNWKILIDYLSKQKFNEIILFTSNTIEQIPHIDINFFIDLLKLPIQKINTIHIEPVKFQYDNKPFPYKTSKHYNRNLKNVLDKLELNNVIKINTIIPQYWGHGINITSQNNTLIEWEKSTK